MVKKYIYTLYILLSISIFSSAQINTDRVMIIGRNALFYEDYVLSIQYFNQVIKAKPYLAEPYFYRAIAKFYLEDTKGAEEDCSLCLERNPFFINAYQLRGDARLDQENYEGAMADYQKTLDYSPDNKYSLINIGIANIQKKDYEGAETSLNELIRVYPTYVQGVLVRGSMFAEKGDTTKAFEDYTKAIELDKYYYPSYSMRGLLYYGKKEYEKALTDLDEAIRIDPIPAGNYINRGLIKYSMNDLRGAMADYNSVVEKEPENIMARFNRGLLRAQVGDDNRAIEDFDMVIQHEPENYIAYLNRALLKENISDRKGALADLNIVLEEYPDFFQGYYMRSEMKRLQNDLKGAEQDFLYARKEEERARKLAYEDNTDTKKGDSKSEKKEKESGTREQSDKTIDKFNLLVVADAEEQQKSKYKNEARGRVQDRNVKIEVEPRFIVSYYEKENKIKNFVHYSSAVEDINKRNIFSRKLLLTNGELALTEEQIKVHFASIDEYSKLIDEQPQNADLYFARGLDYMLVQNFPSAIEDFNKAIKINPNLILVYFNLAVIYTKQLELKDYVPEYEIASLGNLKANGQGKKLDSSKNISGLLPSKEENTDKKIYEYDLAIGNYNKAIDLDPNFVYAYYNRAEIKSMQRDFRAAILDYNEAIRRANDFSEAYFNRGLARLQLGETDKGLADLRKAGELGILNAYNIIKRMTEQK